MPLSETSFSRNRHPRSPFPQNSGKGPVIGQIFSTVASPVAGSGSGGYPGSVSSYGGAMDSNPTDNHPASGFVAPNFNNRFLANVTSYAEDLLNATTNRTSDYFLEGAEQDDNLSLLYDCDNITDSMCLNSSNGTGDEGLEIPEHAYWSLCLLLFPIFTVFGNVLVVMSIYRERSLRHVTNYFIASLAVADLLVAIIVMPPAVFMEVTKMWTLSDELCDAWVAFDVMACTASILNLTAISVDRFIAVTQPIKYAKHKNSKRVHIMLALTWVVSVAIAAPIALGVNYSDERTVGMCSFFNSDFLIYSSMGSFYIPSLIMIFLYYRIYRVLRIRARKSLANKKARSIDTQTLTNVIENTAANTKEPTVKTGLAKIDNGKISTYNTTSNNCAGANTLDLHNESHLDEASTSNPPTNTDSQERDEESDSKSPVHVAKQGELIVNPVAEDLERRELRSGKCSPQVGIAQEHSEMETNFSKQDVNGEDNSSGKQTSSESKERRKKEKKNVTKFNFHMRTSRKRKERSSSRRERKATKTLAIVLGVFLLCWWPFFTVNIMRAICLRYQVLNYPTCDIDGRLMGFFVWLGYINSFLNPVIYTIFNPEFRKAFKKILTGKR